MIALSRIIIFGRDINGLKNFYQSNFNFSLIEEIEGEWAVLQTGSIEIAFHLVGEAYRSESNFGAESNIKLVFATDDLVQKRHELLNNGVKMKEIQFRSYCDGEDLEGNVFQLHQTV